ESLGRRRAYSTGDMVASLGPVDAAAAVVTLRAARFRQIDAEPLEESFTGRRDFPAAIDEYDVATSQEHVADGDPETPGHMIVAHPRFLERGLDAMMRWPTVGRHRRHGHQSLDGPCDLPGAPTVVVAAAPPLLCHHMARVDG